MRWELRLKDRFEALGARSRVEELYRMLVDGHRVAVDPTAAAARARVHLLAGRVRFADEILSDFRAADVGRDRLQPLGEPPKLGSKALKRAVSPPIEAV